MKKLCTVQAFMYDWTFEDEKTSEGRYYTVIRGYGINKRDNKRGDDLKGEKYNNVYFRIEGFTPYCFLELPTIINGEEFVWNEKRVGLLMSKIELMNRDENRPISKTLQMKHKLYMNHRERKVIDGKVQYLNKKYPYLFLRFRSVNALKSFSRSFNKEIYINGIGRTKYKLFEHDWGCTPVLKLFAIQKINSTGWIEVKGYQPPEDKRESSCEIELICNFNTLKKIENEEVLFPKVLSFDIESYSSKWRNNAFPNADNPKDETFQIGIVISRNSKYNDKNIYKKILLTLNRGAKDIEKSKLLSDVIVKTFDKEYKMILEFQKIVKEERPNVVIGYNIFDFDFSFLIKRAKLPRNDCLDQFARFGWLEDKPDLVEDNEKTTESKQQGKFRKPVKLCSEGILYIDLYPLIRSGYKLTNYKLSTVTKIFRVGLKDPLTPQDIFKKYEEQSAEGIAEVGKYCVQDCLVTTHLFEKLYYWTGLCEEAKTNHVPIIYLYTKGQQIKMYSQVYEYCMYQNIVVETGVYESKDNEKYQGAIVLEPVKGYYLAVTPLDFASLYPSIIIAENVDYSTLIDPLDTSFPEEDYNHHCWEEHINCEHDTKYQEKEKKKIEREVKRKENKKEKEAKKRRFIFCDEDGEEIKEITKKMKESNEKKIEEREILDKVKLDMDDCKGDDDDKGGDGKGGDKDKKKKEVRKICGKFDFKWLKGSICKGVIPTLIENLLIARKVTREKLKDVKKEIEKKVKLKEEMEKKEGEKNTKIKEILSEIEDLEIQSIVLDKRQNSYKINANSMYGGMGVKKGYLPFLPAAMCVTYKGRISIGKAVKLVQQFGGKVLYGDTDSCMCQFDQFDKLEKMEKIKALMKMGKNISEESQKLFPKPMKLDFENKLYDKFLILNKKRYITQVVDEKGNIESELNKKGIALQRRDFCTFLKDIYKGVIDYIFDGKDKLYILNFLIGKINDLFQRRYSYEDFIITKSLSREPHLYKTKPAHVFLVEKMIRRGQNIEVGSRIGYILTTRGRYDEKKCRIKKGVKQVEKIEDEEYFKRHRDILRVDFLYYLEKQAIKPIDEVLFVAFGIKDFMKTQYQLRKCKTEINFQIEKIFKPRIELVIGDKLPEL